MSILRRRRTPEDAPPPRPISLAPLTALELSPPELVACAAEAGYDAVGLRLIRATDEEPLRPTIGDTPMIRQTRRRLADTGLTVLDIEVLRLRPQTRVRADYEAVLATGASLGASEVLVTGNDTDHARLADQLSELSVLAGEFGIAPSLEPMPWTEVRDLAEATAILRRCTGAPVGVLVDALHYDRAHNTPAELAALPPEWIRYVQICDGVLPRPTSIDELRYQGRNARLLPGDGCIDLVGMLRALPQVPVSVEAPVLWRAPTAVRVRAALRAARKVVALADTGRVPLTA
ncbi:sugar phosphate isomerase/epimerase family protein [Mycolicibacterium sp.]|uniref:sugar phosphate isomerase/epimerase family protein n=1 Tax=Mycolicibacterium sp. TaxID=2320850 RepID=UPI003D0BEFDE